METKRPRNTTFAPLLPRDAASDPDLQIAASACSSAGLCVSVGSYETKEQTVRALIETVSGSGVSDQVAPIPKGTSSPASDLGAVACPRAASCEAFGYETSSTAVSYTHLLALSNRRIDRCSKYSSKSWVTRTFSSFSTTVKIGRASCRERV